MEHQPTRGAPTSSTDFYTLFTKKLKSKGITLEHLLQVENKTTFTKGDLAQKFADYIQNDEHLYRLDQHGKKLALSRRQIFQQFASHYANGIIQTLGLQIKPPEQVRTLFKTERLLQFIRQSPLEEELQF
jgi:hypothetical protein